MRQGHVQRAHHQEATRGRMNPRHAHDDQREIPVPSGCYLTAREFEARARRNDPGMPLDDEPPRSKRSRQ